MAVEVLKKEYGLVIINIFVAMMFFGFFENAHGATIGRPQNNLGLVGYWNFDAGKGGSTVYDLSGQGNHGSFDSGMDPSTDWVRGKIGNAIDFDDNNTAEIETGTVDYAIGTGDFTISVWVVRQSNNTNFSGIIGVNGANPGLFVEASGSNIGASAGSVVTSNTTLTIGEWSHVVLRRASGTVEFFINTLRDDTSFTSSSNFNSGTIRLGTTELGSAQNHSDILLDEARIYNRALSIGEIERLYKLGNSGGQTFATSPTVIGDGLVGHWTFDGPNLTTATATDSSGSGNNGTLTGGLSASDATIGTLGQALAFDGNDDHIVVPNQSALQNPSSAFSVSAWAKLEDNTQNGWIWAQYDSGGATFQQQLIFNTSINQYRTRVDTGVGPNTTLVDFGDNTTGEWQHFVIVYDGSDVIAYLNGDFENSGSQTGALSVADHTFFIGARFDGSYFNGSIDDVRIYDRALSADEVRRLYSATKQKDINTSKSSRVTSGLVGHWTFDGPNLTTATATDSSGSGNNGTLTGGLSASDATIGTLGQALAFDGVDDYVQIPAGNGSIYDVETNPFTISMWLKATFSDGDGTRYALRASENNRFYEIAYNDDSNRLEFLRDSGSGASNNATAFSSADLRDGEWYHVVAVSPDADNISLYVDGVLNDTDTKTSGFGVNIDTDLFLGSNTDGTGNFEGSMDDVRFYDRALSADEVKRLYAIGK